MQTVPRMLTIFTTRPLDFFNRGRKVLLTSIRPHKLASAILLNWSSEKVHTQQSLHCLQGPIDLWNSRTVFNVLSLNLLFQRGGGWGTITQQFKSMPPALPPALPLKKNDPNLGQSWVLGLRQTLTPTTNPNPKPKPKLHNQRDWNPWPPRYWWLNYEASSEAVMLSKRSTTGTTRKISQW